MITQIDLLAVEHEFDLELESLINWWQRHSVDTVNGGFYGEIDNNNQPQEKADKAIVLNARLLWFFSTAWNHLGDENCKNLANRAYAYLIEHFEDQKHGGFYWHLDYRGKVIDSKKMGYAQAFAIYALAAYWRCSNNPQALEKALCVQRLLEEKSKDQQQGGYLEAFDQAWQPITDMRLSDIDKNSPKTMNNHLHILEAYTELYLTDKNNKNTERALTFALHCYCDRFVLSNNRLSIYCDNDWQDNSDHYSLGHEIESSWLILKALDALNNEQLNTRYLATAIAIADNCKREGLGSLGQLYDEYSFNKGYNEHRIWWNQAEAIIGFLYVYKKTGEEDYLEVFSKVWRFAKAFQVDTQHGEWLYHSRLDKHIENPYKAGAWKGPYHNGRALLFSKKILEQLTRDYKKKLA